MPDAAELSKRERQIMEAIWARGSATATEVMISLSAPPSRTAVRTLLTILERKGHLKHRRSGREFVYSPVKPRAQVAKSALRRLLRTFFEGSIERAVAARLADRSEPLSPDEMGRIIRMVEQARIHGR
jgi:predicted transcriptional regulator